MLLTIQLVRQFYRHSNWETLLLLEVMTSYIVFLVHQPNKLIYLTNNLFNKTTFGDTSYLPSYLPTSSYLNHKATIQLSSYETTPYLPP